MAKPKAASVKPKGPAKPKRPAARTKAVPAKPRKGARRAGLDNRMERLWTAVQEVREGRRDSPRTARLLSAGPPKMAQKVVEEAAEVAIEAVQGRRDALINESVDILYNLAVIWNACGVDMEAIWAEMDRREAAFGMSEKLPKTDDV